MVEKTEYLKLAFPRLKVLGLQIYLGMLSVVTEEEPTEKELKLIEEALDGFVYETPPEEAVVDDVAELIQRLQKGELSAELKAQLMELTSK